MTDHALAAAQAAVLEVLGDAPDLDGAQARLAADPRCEPLRAWLSSGDPRMIEVMRQIVQRWRRTSEG